jgi:hypothetical protein
MAISYVQTTAPYRYPHDVAIRELHALPRPESPHLKRLALVIHTQAHWEYRSEVERYPSHRLRFSHISLQGLGDQRLLDRKSMP